MTNGAPDACSYSLELNHGEMQALSCLWSFYFESQPFMPQDPKLQVVAFFRGFLVSGDGSSLLTKACDDLTSAQIVTFDYAEFCQTIQAPDFQQILYDKPEETLACLGLALCLARNALLQVAEETSSGLSKLRARFVNVEPVIPMASLKSATVGRFVALRATVVRCSAIHPLVLRAEFECSKCGARIMQPFPDGTFTMPEACTTPRCRNRAFELRRDTAETVDFQKIKVQEIEDNSSEPGRMPRTVEVELSEDLVDTCIPGDEVVVAGIVKTMSAEAASGRRPARDGRHQSLYLLYLQANSITNRRQTDRDDEEDTETYKMDAAKNFKVKHLCAIRMIANDRFCFELLVASLCPAIFGHELVKAGLILTLMGGSKRHNPTAARTRVRIRSDPHILLVGDPGLGKSQLLRAAAAVAPRSVYVCGQVVTSTGLTVTLVNEGRGDVGLEAGALVLSDQGVCCIDELDKLSCSFHALLEAMEQQQVSIAKSGVVASLSARCSVIAAANPAGGHYHRGKTVSENLKMSGALFSRFDLVFIMLDRPDENHDERLSRHIVNMHASRTGVSFGSSQDSTSPGISLTGSTDRSERTLSQRLRLVVPDLAKDPIPHELLRKYVAYARKYIHPRLTPAAGAVIKELYLKMREEARLGRSMPITLRQLESLIRLAQARARAELRDWVTEDDALDVVEMMQESLLDAYTSETGEVDFAHHTGSMSLAKQVKAFVAQLNKESDKRGTSLFQRADLMELAERMRLKISDFDRFLDVLNAECYLLKKGPRLYQVTTSNSVG